MVLSAVVRSGGLLWAVHCAGGRYGEGLNEVGRCAGGLIWVVPIWVDRSVEDGRRGGR